MLHKICIQADMKFVREEVAMGYTPLPPGSLKYEVNAECGKIVH